MESRAVLADYELHEAQERTAKEPLQRGEVTKLLNESTPAAEKGLFDEALSLLLNQRCTIEQAPEAVQERTLSSAWLRNN